MKTTPANITKTLKKSNWFQIKSKDTSKFGDFRHGSGFVTYQVGDAVRVTYILDRAIRTIDDSEKFDAMLRWMQKDLQKAGFMVTRQADNNYITVH